jgi:hypothetical protein
VRGRALHKLGMKGNGAGYGVDSRSGWHGAWGGSASASGLHK